MEKYCVRIKSNGIIGSGVLLPGKETFYVLTAAHCLGESIPNIDNIIIEKQSDYASEFKSIKGVDIKEFNIEHDFALIEIDFEEDKTQYLYKVGGGMLPENEIKFCGYQSIKKNEYRPFNGKILSISENLGCFKITLLGKTFDQGGEDGHFLAKGLSGSGVFIYRYNSPFLIGILNSVVTDKAWNDDIECCSVKHIEQYLSEYIDLSDFENLKKWNETLEKERTQKEIEEFKNENSDFFNKLYRKNQVLYPHQEARDSVTVEQIRQYLSMKENIDQLANEYPHLFKTFKSTISKFINRVKFDYSQNVQRSNEALNLKKDLQNELARALEVLPKTTNYDLSDFQIIEWLGMCTLNFTQDD